MQRFFFNYFELLSDSDLYILQFWNSLFIELYFDMPSQKRIEWYQDKIQAIKTDIIHEFFWE